LPERGSVYSIEEDHENSKLIFCGTEFGFFFSNNGGKNWKKISNGLPTISVRDIAIQRTENDIVLGTFGRGFYVLDDYSSLRHIDIYENPIGSKVFPIRPSLMWEKSSPLGRPAKAFQGDDFYLAENLDPVALITYYNDTKFESLESKRKKKESKLLKDKKDIYYPTYDELKKEEEQINPELVFTIRDENSEIIKKIFKPVSKGLNRIEWNLRYESKYPVLKGFSKSGSNSRGTLVNPGTYSVEMLLIENENITELSDPVNFEVIALNNTTMPADDRKAKVDFQRKVDALQSTMGEYSAKLAQIKDKIPYIEEALKRSDKPVNLFNSLLNEIKNQIKYISISLYGDDLLSKIDQQEKPTPYYRLGYLAYEQKNSTSSPTNTHLNSFEIAYDEFQPIIKKIEDLKLKFDSLEVSLKENNIPYTPERIKEKF